MNNTIRLFELKDDKSSKFWEVTQSNNVVIVRYGKIGTAGQSQSKEFADASAADKHVQKLVAEKTGKGYVEQGAIPLAAEPITPAPSEAKPTKARTKAITPKAEKSKSPLQDPDAMPESLAVLLGKDDATNRKLAKHPKASSELLEKLSHSSDKATRQAVTGNPNTPPETLVKLGQQFPKEFLVNPALDLLLLENPALFDDVPKSLLLRIVGSDRCPTDFLLWAAGKDDEKVQLSVAANSAAPQEALQKLCDSNYERVRASAFGRTGSKNSVQEDPESSFNSAVKERLAVLKPGAAFEAWEKRDIGLPQWPYLSPSVRLLVLGTEWGTSFIRSPFFPKAVWEEVASDVDSYLPTILCDLANSPVAPSDRLPDLLMTLAAHPDSEVRKGIAQHPELQAESLRSLLEDDDSAVVAAAASNPRALVEVLGRLATSADEDIRIGVARNPSAPRNVLEQLLEDPSPYVRNSVCANPVLSEKVGASKLGELVKIAQEDLYLSRMVAANPRATTEHLEELLRAHHEDYWDVENIKIAALFNPSATSTFLRSMSGLKPSDSWHRQEIQLALASHPNTPLDILHQIVTGKDNDLRQVALSNPSLPSDLRDAILAQIVGVSPSPFDNVWTRKHARRASESELNATRDGKFLHYCGKDPNKAVLARRPLAPLFALISGPYVEPARIAKVVGSTDWLVRAAVARNSGTPPNLLRKLSNDAHPLVAALAVSNLQRSTAENSGSLDDSAASHKDSPALPLRRACEEIVIRLRKGGHWDQMMTDSAWSDQATVLDVWHSLPDEAIDKLHDSLDEPLRVLMWELGASSSDESIRLRIATRLDCPPQVLQILAADNSPKALLAVIGHPALHKESRPRLVKAIKKALRGGKAFEAAHNAKTPPEILIALAGSSDWRVRAGIARNPSTPPTVLESLVKDKSIEVRDALASNPSTSSSVLEQLAFDDYMGVRRTVARHPATSAALLASLAKDDNEQVRFVVAKNPTTPVDVLKVLAEEVSLHEAVAANPAAPVEVLTELAEYKNSANALAWNEAAPLPIRQKLLAKFAEEEDKWVRERVAGCQATTDHVLRSLAHDPDRVVRKRVSSNPVTSVKVLEHLAADLDPYVRLSVAQNQNTDAGIRQQLLENLGVDEAWNVRRDLGENSNTPPKILALLARDVNKHVRCAVASNPATPPTTLESLMSDSDPDIRVAVARNPAAPFKLRDQFTSAWVNIMHRALLREHSSREGALPRSTGVLQPTDVFRALIWLGYVKDDADNKELTKASRSKDWLTRLGSALHPKATDGVLKLLLQDSDPDVAAAARMRLNDPERSSA